MSDETTSPGAGQAVAHRRSLSRRDMIKRTAVAGAAVAWAVPVVEVLGTRAADASVTNGSGASGSSSKTIAFFITYPGYSNFDGLDLIMSWTADGADLASYYNVSGGVLSYLGTGDLNPTSTPLYNLTTYPKDPFSLQPPVDGTYSGVNSNNFSATYTSEITGSVPNLSTDALTSLAVGISTTLSNDLSLPQSGAASDPISIYIQS